MANPTSSKLRGLALSGVEVRALTGWSDAMVEDYLNILENLITLANEIDGTNTEVESAETSVIANLFPPLKDVPATAVVSADLTSSGEQKIICTNTPQINITLNAIPDDMELTTVQATKGPVLVDGNGKKINGENTVFMQIPYTSLDFLYIVEIDAWVIS